MKRNLGYYKQDPYGEKPLKSSGQNFYDYKSKALKAAEDLRYGKECYEAIKSAETSDRITRIMATYRKRS